VIVLAQGSALELAMQSERLLVLELVLESASESVLESVRMLERMSVQMSVRTSTEGLLALS
jgi:hypothetical protein